jgi:predicted nucleic acid-binding protein
VSARTTAFLDACVLYSARLRDLMITLAVADCFRPRWSAQVHEEWMRAVIARNPDITRKRLERTRRLMDAAVQDCLVVAFEHLIPALRLPDPQDVHVLAAAIRCRAELIVTFNLRHFPESALAIHKLRAIHPDEFILGLLTKDAPAVCAALRRLRLRLTSPVVTQAQYVKSLAGLGLPSTAATLMLFIELL